MMPASQPFPPEASAGSAPSRLQRQMAIVRLNKAAYAKFKKDHHESLTSGEWVVFAEEQLVCRGPSLDTALDQLTPSRPCYCVQVGSDDNEEAHGQASIVEVRIILSASFSCDDLARRALLAIGVDMATLAGFIRPHVTAPGEANLEDEIIPVLTDAGLDDSVKLRTLHALGVYVPDLLEYLAPR
jgi:hypothetical protein